MTNLLRRLGRRRPQTPPGRKLALIASSGGHLKHLLVLRPWWERHERMWVTFNTADARSALSGERVYWAHHPTNRNARNLLRNTLLAWKILLRERPAVIISSGAGVAVPFFWLGKMLGVRTVYIEVVDRVVHATLTGRLVHPVTDRFLVQWEEQASLYPDAEVVGRLL